MLASDYDALRSGAAICTLPGHVVVRVVGDDRAAFLHGICSNDIKAASSGTIVPALFLTEHAHIIADFFAWIEDQAILIDIDAALWARAREHLGKLLVADDVEFEELNSLALIDIEGPRAMDVVHTLVPQVELSPWSFARADGLRVGGIARYGQPGVTILAPVENAVSVVSSAASTSESVRSVDYETIDIFRIENGVARIGVDTGDRTIALEARLERAISLNKGCYVGQETIERATARGGIRKRLFGVKFSGDQSGDPGGAIMLNGKEVGHLTSTAHSPRFGNIGLAILHNSAGQPGTAVTVSSGDTETSAEVSELPFG